VKVQRKGRRYTISEPDVGVVPSVTTILSCLDKGGGLTWWAQGVGVEGVLRLIADENLPGYPGEWANRPKQVVSMLKEHHLTINHQRDAAASRGLDLHKLLEWYAEDPNWIPDPSKYPEDRRGYIQALASWLSDTRPRFHKTEVVVGSAKYRYAGTFDFLATIDGEFTLGDLKTSRRVYDTHHLQLEGYRQAWEEMGGELIERRIVVRLDESGAYEVVDSEATPEMFIAVRDCFDSVKGLEAAIKKQNKLARRDDQAEELVA
jgi:hypothetical protein